MNRILSRNLLPRSISMQIIRCVNRQTQVNQVDEQNRKKPKIEKIVWRNLFVFTDMKYLALVTRLKKYPVIATVFLVPTTFLIETMEWYPGVTIVPSLVFGITSTSILCIYSLLLKNTIGIIYTCPENKRIRIAYIDFIGRQRIHNTTASQLMKYKKSKPKFGLYKQVKVIDDGTEINLKLPLIHSDIYDITFYRKLFGK